MPKTAYIMEKLGLSSKLLDRAAKAAWTKNVASVPREKRDFNKIMQLVKFQEGARAAKAIESKETLQRIALEVKKNSTPFTTSKVNMWGVPDIMKGTKNAITDMAFEHNAVSTGGRRAGNK